MLPNQNTYLLAIVSNPQTRRALQELVNRAEFVLDFVETGQMGLRKAHEALPDVILVDDVLDDSSSDEVCRILRADRHLSGVPIIMLVDENNRSAKSIGLGAGVDDFLTKPFDSIELRARLRAHTRLHLYSKLISDLGLFYWMVKHAQEGYLLLNQDFVIQYANERAINLLTLPEDPTGLGFIQVVERQYMVKPVETWLGWLQDPSPCFVMRPENVNANAFWLVMEGLDTTVGVEHYRVVRLRDVTEKMNIYHDIRKFHTAITHKLRTPVSMLASSVSLINAKLAYLTPEQVKELMETSLKGAERLVREVRDVLTYIDAPLSLQIGEPVAMEHVPGVIGDACKRLQIEDVSLSIPDFLRTFSISMTPDALDLILEELLENTKKFHPRHTPHVDISAGQIEEGFVRIRIVDDGVTLTPEQLAWAWLPYFQGERNFTGELPGMGLGFPLVATLVWQSGGDLRLSNRHDGPGVIVEMKIPLVKTKSK